MVLNDVRIREMVKNGYISNCLNDMVNPASINIRLDGTFAKLAPREYIMLGEELEYEASDLPFGRIGPGEFLLASTMEEFNLPNDISAFVQGRSSIGRIGLSIQNAGFVDPGFHGHITLELKNETASTIMLPYGYPVGQLVFFDTDLVEKGYDGKYNGQNRATGSRMHLDKGW